MKSIVEVALVQMDIQSIDPETNIDRARHFVSQTVTEKRPDILLLPELLNSGYVIGLGENFPTFSETYYQIAERIPGPFTKAISELSKEYGIYILFGILEADPVVECGLHNSAILLNPAGEISGIHRKTRLPAEEKHYFKEGEKIEVFSTDLGKICIGICADIFDPEFSRVAYLKGAEMIFFPYNAPLLPGFEPDWRFHVVSSRAFENSSFVGVCNRVGTEGTISFDGRSCACGPRGEFLGRSENEEEEIVRATLKAEDLYTARLRMATFRDRRPELYGPVSQV